jgi:cardiolipin synthase
MRNSPKILFKPNFWILVLIAAQVAAIVFLCLYLPVFLPITVALAATWAFTAATSLVLLIKEGSPEVKCAWFVVIATLPVAGALIYFFASVKKKPQGILKIDCNGLVGLSRAANLSCGTAPAEYLDARYFSSGTKFWNLAVAEIANAKKSVNIEFFIIGRGHLLTSVVNALEQARNNGAEVNIICDGVGSAFRISRRDVKKLERLGAKVKVFHRLPPFPRANINLRDHRKIITVDGRVAFTGGVNLADEYINIDSPYGFWKDTGLAIYGEAAKIFEGMFLAMWHGHYEMPAPKQGEKNCLPFYDSPYYRSFCEDAFISSICAAKERVHVFTPYFCASDKLAAALAFTAKRGVDVSVIIPHIPDKKYAFEVSKAFAGQMKKSGVKFYEYAPGFMHAKTLICDDKVFLGSYNFDFRSTHFNYECGVVFEGKICDEVERDFQDSLALSVEMQDGKLSRLKRLSNFVLRLFAPLV